MADVRIADLDWIKWIMSGMGAVIMLLLGFGVKDIRGSLSKIPELISAVHSLEIFIVQIEKRLEKVERECIEKHRD